MWEEQAAGVSFLSNILDFSHAGEDRGREEGRVSKTSLGLNYETLCDVFILVCGRSRLREFFFYHMPWTSLMRYNEGGEGGREEGRVSKHLQG